jgi:lipoyl(octanoyl) transferase
VNLHLLPDRTASAAENMAADFLLLNRYPEPETIRFRHYGWRHPACTFGYSQKINEIREHLPADGIELCRRPTGGGLVDHRNDWTYALVLPRRHPLCSARAGDSYRRIHDVIRRVLEDQGHPVVLQEPERGPGKKRSALAGVCFARAENFDVVHRDSGAKVAGAAQKRTTRGLLFQGSLERSSLPECDWEGLADALADGFARALAGNLSPAPWPDIDPDEESGLIEQFGSEEWLARR